MSYSEENEYLSSRRRVLSFGDEHDLSDNYSSIDGFFSADNAVVVGAWSNSGHLAYVLAESLANNFKGNVILVNFKGQSLFKNRLTVKSIEELPILEGKTFAVLLVGAHRCIDYVKALLQKNIHHLVILSGGFAETDENGKIWQTEIVKLCKAHNARLVGPNCMGLLMPKRGIDCIFLPEKKLLRPLPGPVSLFTQSGGLMLALCNELSLHPIKNWINHVVSFGNAADVNETDAIEYFGFNSDTKQIWGYIEGVRGGAKFLKIARKVSLHKPILVKKANRTEAGARASASHSASLSSNTKVSDCLLRRSGIIHVEKWSDFLDTGSAFQLFPLPLGPNVGIITIAGGQGVMCADVIDTIGLKLAHLDKATIKQFEDTMPRVFSFINPIDLTGSATNQQVVDSVSLLFNDSNVNMIILILLPSVPNIDSKSLVPLLGDCLKANCNEFGQPKKPIVSVLFGAFGAERLFLEESFWNLNIPVYHTEEQAVRVLRDMYFYFNWVEKEKYRILHQDSNTQIEIVDKIIEDSAIRAENIFKNAISEGRFILLEHEAASIVDQLGIPLPHSKFVTCIDDVSSAWNDLKCDRVVVKLISSQVVHKTDEKAVQLNIKSEDELKKCFTDFQTRFKDRDFRGILVVEQVQEGLELFIGSNTDKIFGPIIVTGIGGIFIEILRDVVFSTCPVSQIEAIDMLDSLEHQNMLNGFRGFQHVDRARIAQIISAISRLAIRHSRYIKELDLNPIIVTSNGPFVVDFRIVLYNN